MFIELEREFIGQHSTSFGVLQISPVTLPKICILASLRHALGQSLRQFLLRLGQDRSVGRAPGQRNDNGEPHECPCDVSNYGCIPTHADPPPRCVPRRGLVRLAMSAR